MPLQPLRKDDLQIGKPIPYSVYDKDRVLLLSHGCVVESDTVLSMLREQGMFSDDSKPKSKGGLRYQPSVIGSRVAVAEAAGGGVGVGGGRGGATGQGPIGAWASCSHTQI